MSTEDRYDPYGIAHQKLLERYPRDVERVRNKGYSLDEHRKELVEEAKRNFGDLAPDKAVKAAMERAQDMNQTYRHHGRTKPKTITKDELAKKAMQVLRNRKRRK